LAILEQTATGKGTSNPLLAGSLSKTTKLTQLDVAVLLKRHNYLKEQTLCKLKVKIYSVKRSNKWYQSLCGNSEYEELNYLEVEPALTGETSGPPTPKTAKQLAARRNQERVKSILLVAIPDEYLLKFHNVANAKSLWEAIKSRFGGNVESKKMQKNVLKHQF
ncbi:hypothetical protein Tco_1013802, partial [Tanacetum coccineum]